MQFETLFEFNEQEFQLKIFNDKSFVYIQLMLTESAILWCAIADLNKLVEKFNFLDGCFFQPEDLAEYLIYQVNNGEFRLESNDDESKILNLIFWIQKESEEEIEQYNFYFSLAQGELEIEKNEAEETPKINELEKPKEDKLESKGSNLNSLIMSFKSY